MAKKELLTLLRSATVEDLKELLALKKDLDALEKKQNELLTQFASVSKDLGSIQASFGTRGRGKGKTRRAVGRKRVAQPSLNSLIEEILKDAKKPMGVNDICDALLKQKNYRTKAKSFKSNVRILLYKNERGAFKKKGPGRFVLAVSRKK
jgi:hypothetical protein